MTEVISEVVDRMMRSFFLESGGEPKKSIEEGVEKNSIKPIDFGIETETAKEVAASVGKSVLSALERVREKLSEAGSPYELSIDPGTNRVIIKMVDPASGAVERQFPEQSLIELSKRLEDLTGSVIDAKT
jgi:flagellar protein FlaG